MPTWNTPGSYTYSIPSSVDRLEVRLVGGRGGTGANGDTGGDPAEMTATLLPSDLPSTLEVRVGGDGGDGNNDLSQSGGEGGYNGGGDSFTSGFAGDEYSSGGGAGGASDIRADGGGNNDRYVVAAGGGGSSGSNNGEGRSGGDGGAPNGSDGSDLNSGYTAGGGATQSSGGSAGQANDVPGSDGVSGGFGSGADGVRYADGDGNRAHAGGGGGGYYGGGSGSVRETDIALAAGGGGGSSWAGAIASDVSYSVEGVDSELVEITEVVVSASNLSETYVGASEVDLNWDGQGADEYRVERDGSSVGTTTSTSFTDTTPSENTAHDYQIVAVSGGADLDTSNTLTVTTGGPPAGSTATAGSREATLSIESLNGDFTEVRVLRDGAGSTGDVVYSGAPNTNLTDTGLLDGEGYTYRFEAVYPRSTSSEATDSVLLPLPAPTDLTVTSVTATSIATEFTDNANNRASYAIEVSEDNTGNWVRTDTTTNTVAEGQTASITATGLLHGQFYGVRVVVITSDTEEVDQ